VSFSAALTLGWSPTFRAAITIGFIGGLTTYSSFSYETMRLFEEGAPGPAAMNLALTLLGGLIAPAPGDSPAGQSDR
jgi:CrcB protein